MSIIRSKSIKQNLEIMSGKFNAKKFCATWHAQDKGTKLLVKFNETVWRDKTKIYFQIFSDCTVTNPCFKTTGLVNSMETVDQTSYFKNAQQFWVADTEICKTN
jgi:hypothetical protein